MKVIKRYNQSRRDLTIDLECEGCGFINIGSNAYDDRNFWDNVIPKIPCRECGKSSNDLGTDNEHISTKYGDYEVI